MQSPQKNKKSGRSKRATLPTVREATLELMRSLGIHTLFGNPGSTELPFLDRWPEDIRYVLGLQEASVVGMADGYARATGRPAFVNLHSAAGLGHALGNVFTAYRNRAPMVIIAGQQARELLPNLPYLGATNASEFPKPYVKYSIEPARAEDVPTAIAHAYRIAMQRPQGPTFVSVPVDDWSKPCRPVPDRTVSCDVAPDPALIGLAAGQLAGAGSPVFVVGSEVDEENAGPSIVALAEHLNAPVYTAPFAARICFPEDHPLFAGFLPAAPTAVAKALADYDLIVVAGAPVFTYHVPSSADLIQSGIPIVHLTTDSEAAASAPFGTTILGSLRLSLPMLTELTPKADRPAPRRRQRTQAATLQDSGSIAPQSFLYQLGQAMPANALLMEEAPSIRPAMQAQITMREWGSFYTMASGGLGYGLPGAVGLALARPNRTVVCLIGDGSFMYSPQALWTAVQHRLDLKIVVVNNGGYGAMRSFSQTLQVRDVPGIDVTGLDFLQLAEGMGCRAQRVSVSAQLIAALSETFSGAGPSLLEVVVDQEIQHLYN